MTSPHATPSGEEGPADAATNEEEEVIFYSNAAASKTEKSLSAMYRKSQNQKPSPARVAARHQRDKADSSDALRAISAVEVNPAYFGFAPASSSADPPTAGETTGIPRKRLGSIPVLPPNLDELRAQLRVLHTTKKRKTSPIKKALPPRTAPQNIAPSRIPQPPRPAAASQPERPPPAAREPEKELASRNHRSPSRKFFFF